MKIAYIHSAIIPSTAANSVHVMKMCDAISELGHDITLIVPKIDGAKINDQNLDQYGTHNNFTILPIWRLRSRLGYLAYGIQSVSTALKMKPDLIYTRCMSSAFALAFLKKPFIYEIHQNPINKIERYLTRRIANAKNCLRLVTISHELKRLLVKVLPKATSKIVIAHDAVNLKDFDDAESTCPKNIVDRCKNKVICLYVGTITTGRGIEQIIKSALEHREVEFVFVGNIDSKFEAVRKNIPENITFIGRMPYIDIPGIMKWADILVLPYQPEARIMNRYNSSTGEYCSPMKAFEYMAAKGAIVCSDTPNLREIYINDESAIFVSPPHSINAWSESLGKVISSPKLMHNLSRNAYVLAQKHTWLRRAETILSDIL